MSIEKTNIKTNVAILIIYIIKFWQIVFFAAFCARLFHKRFERLSCKPLQRILLRKALRKPLGHVLLRKAFLQAFGACSFAKSFSASLCSAFFCERLSRKPLGRVLLRKPFRQPLGCVFLRKAFPQVFAMHWKFFLVFRISPGTFRTFCVKTGKTFLLFCGNAVNITVIILFIIDVLLQFIFKTMQNYQIRAKNISVLYRK